MSVHARFRLDQVTRSRGYYKAPGEEETQSVEAAYVTLNAVQGEPFAVATPTGHWTMLIVNPAASQVFFDATLGQEFDVLLTPCKEGEGA